MDILAQKTFTNQGVKLTKAGDPLMRDTHRLGQGPR